MISKKLFSIMFNIIKLNEKDNIGVAPMSIPKNTEINLGVFTKDKITWWSESEEASMYISQLNEEEKSRHFLGLHFYQVALLDRAYQLI